MNYILAADSGLVEWANTVIAIVGIVLAIVAIVQTRRSNASARQANDISRGANDLAGQANRYAEKAVQMQEDEGKVRLVVKPRIMRAIGAGTDTRPRPMVEVVNLSAFPVTITQLWWKTDKADGTGLIWINPTVTSPHGAIPARLASRDAFTAIGIPDFFDDLATLQSVTACVAVTACGESIEGMTESWKENLAKMTAEARLKKPNK
jgi:hypothetical protein